MNKFKGLLRDWREPRSESSTKPRLLASTMLGSLAGEPSRLKAKRRPKKQKLEVESLEPRILLAADPLTATLGAGITDVTVGFDDNSTADTADDRFIITNNDLPSSAVNFVVASKLVSETSEISITGSTSDDRVVIDDLAGNVIFPVDVFFDGAGGTDELAVPSGAGAGFDATWILDDTGGSSVDEAGGSDGFEVGFAGVEKLVSGAGDDTFTVEDLSANVTIDAGAGDDEVILNAPLPGTVSSDGGTISVDGQTVTLDPAGDVSEISGNVGVNFNDFRTVVDETFQDIATLFDAIEDVSEFATSLPLISGSGVGGVLDASIGTVLGLGEAVDELRLGILDAIDDASAGAQTINSLQSALDDLTGSVESLGAAIVSDIAASSAQIQALIATATDAANEGFSFALEIATPDGPISTNITVSLAAVNAVTTGSNFIDKLITAINQEIASSDLSGQVLAVASDGIGVGANEGRVAFQAVGADITQLAVNSLDFGGAGVNLANSVLGISSVQEVLANVDQILTALDPLSVVMRGVDISVDTPTNFGFDFRLESVRQSNFAFDFGTAAESVGLEFDAKAQLTAEFGFVFDASLDLSLTGGSNVDFTAAVNELGAGIALMAGSDANNDGVIAASEGVMVDATFGFLAVNASVGAELQAGIVATAEAFTSADISSGASAVASGFGYSITGFDSSGAQLSLLGTTPVFAVNASFTADASLVSGTATLSFDLGGGNPFTGGANPNFDFGTSVDSFLDFNNLTPTTAIQGLQQLINAFDDLANSPLISGIEIPFVEGGLDAILDIAGVVQNALLFDFGADGEADGDDKLIVDLNNALTDAGLERFLQFSFNEATGNIQIEIIDDDVSAVNISFDAASVDLGINTATLISNGAVDLTGALAITGILSGALKASVSVTTSAGTTQRDLEAAADVFANNIGFGDDVAKLLDAAGTARFGSAQEFAEVLEEIGLLPDGLSDLINYDEAEQRLTFQIEIDDRSLFDIELPVDFELDLSPILEAQSDTRIVLSGSGSLALAFGFDLTTDLSGPNPLPSATAQLDGGTTLDSLDIPLKAEPAITGTSDPSSVQGVLTSDATFTVTVEDSSGAALVTETITVEADNTINNTSAAQLASQINALIQTSGLSVTETNGVLEVVWSGNVVGQSVLKVTVEAGDPAIGQLGLQPSLTADISGASTTVSAVSAVAELIGVLSSDASFTLQVTESGVAKTFNVTVDEAATKVTNVGGSLTGAFNRNILELQADVEAALDDAEFNGESASDLFEVLIQGNRLVISLKADASATAFQLIGSSSSTQLGFANSTINADFNDLVIYLEGGDEVFVDIPAAGTGSGASGAVTIQDVLDAITASDAQITAILTPDDPDTPEDESGTSITVFTENTAREILSITATNGSETGSGLGLVGAPAESADDLPGQTTNPVSFVTSRDIAGVTIFDRFFIQGLDDNGNLSTTEGLDDIASFGFSAQAGRLATELQVVDDFADTQTDGTVVFSPDIDFRDFVGETIEVRNVGGFDAGTYTISEAVEVDLDGDGDADGFGAVLVEENATDGAFAGTIGQGGGVAIIQSGVDASAGLGFVDIILGGSADFGADLTFGLNTNPGNVADDNVVTVGELIDALTTSDDEAETSFIDRILSVVALPELTLRTDSNPEIDLGVSIAAGSTDFSAISDALFGEGVTPGVEIDVLAIGDPFIKTRFDGALSISGNTITIIGDQTDLFVDGVKLRLTIDNTTPGGEDFRADFTADVELDGGNTVLTLNDFTPVNFEEGAAGAPTADLTGVTLNDVESIFLLPSAEVTPIGLDALSSPDFANFGITEIIAALQALTDFLSQFEEFEFLSMPIPVIDKSLSDLITLSSDLAAFVDGLAENPANSLQFLEDAINDAIGLDQAALEEAFVAANPGASAPTGDDTLDDAFDLGYDADNKMLTFELMLGAGFSETLDVGFDGLPFGDIFADLGLDQAIEFSGSAGLEATGGVFAELALGIDIDAFTDALSDPATSVSDALAQAIFLLDSTGIAAALTVSGTDIAFAAGLGPLSLTIQSDPDDPNLQANVTISAGAEVKPNDTFDTTAGLDRVSLDTLLTGNVLDNLGNLFDISGPGAADDALATPSFGTVGATLPIFFPNDGTLLGSIRVGDQILSPDDGSQLPQFGNLAALVGGGGLEIQTDTFATEAELLAAFPGDPLLIDVSEIIDGLTGFDFSQLSVFDGLILAADGFDLFLELLEEDIFGNLAQLDLPLVGDGFADAAGFIGDFRDGFVGPFRQTLDELSDASRDFADPDKNIISVELFELLGPNGLNILLRLDGEAIDPLDPGSAGDYVALDSDVLDAFLNGGDGPRPDLSDLEILWEFELGQNIPVPDLNFGFDLGIPGLGLEAEGDLELMLDWSLALGFGLSTAQGFFFTINPDETDPELEFEIQATLPDNASLTGSLGFLQLVASNGSRDIDGDGEDETTMLTASFGLDIFEEGATGEDADRLGFTEFGNLGITFGAKAEAAAVLDFRLGLDPDVVGTSVARNFPSVVADFNFLWSFDDGSGGLAGPEMFSTALGDSLRLVEFENVALDAGEFLSGVVKPIVDQIAEVTEPLQPILDFLTAPVPILSDLGVNLTILDIAATFGNVNPGLISSIAEIIQIINDLAALPDDVNLLLPIIDEFVIFDAMNGAANGMNPFNDDLTGGSNRDMIVGMNAGNVRDLDAELERDDLVDDSDPDADRKRQSQSALNSIKNSATIAFPFIQDPSSLLGLLLGDPITLVTADLEPLVVGFTYTQFFSIFGPLGISIEFIIEAAADFAFGFDTFGIQEFVDTGAQNPFLILNGFFVSDRENADGTGADVPELTLLGGIVAAAELNLGIARAGVAGGLFIEILFDLFDPDNDGKVRITELFSNIENQLRAPGAEKLLAPLAIFDVTGRIFAELFAFLKIDFGFFSVEKEFPITGEITIVDFEIDFFRPPVVATEQDNGDLVINVGPFAPQRLLSDAFDFGENITVRKTGESGNNITVEVFSSSSTGLGNDTPTSGNAFSYEIAKGGKLIIDGGEGNDTITLENFDGDDLIFMIDGGVGNDTIAFTGSPVVTGGTKTTGFNTITGGAGNDNIIGSNGTDLIIGGEGNDTLHGGEDQDVIIGDTADFLFDFDDSDPPNVTGSRIVAGVNSSDGRDSISGDSGADIIFGGGAQDNINAGQGANLVLGDGGTVNFNGDFTTNTSGLSGKLRALTDNLVDGADDDGAADTITAGSDDDIIFAGVGNDVVNDSGGDNTIFGGDGFDDITVTGVGTDIIFGDTGEVLAGIEDLSGASLATLLNNLQFLRAGSGGSADNIASGGSGDIIIAGDGNDSVDAGAGDDLVLGGAGADLIIGGAGGDSLLGEAGPDEIRGGSENDTISGGTGGDSVLGEGGNDLIIATQGADKLNAGEGDDTYQVRFQGGSTTSTIVINDSSGLGDILSINGTDLADNILLRVGVAGDAFIANINGEFDVERVNYNSTVERIIINGGFGDDFFASDDTAAEITINGDAGNDVFQIGQLFRTERNQDANIALASDFFATIEVTRGFLSNGISEPMTINGGLGDDSFTVYHNKAVLQLNGDEGDDVFEVRAFALVGSQEPQRERTDLSGGAGADLVRYAVNAPVNIDGGDGLDTLSIIGTEFGDDFVITEDGVFGAGLNVNFVNIETLRVDGAEGDDRFFIQSTKESVVTEILGGLGNDSFFASGDTPPVVSNDLLGHSGIILNEVESNFSGSAYDGQAVPGISANVADADEPFAVIRQTEGSTIITEGDTTGDTYEIVLTREPTTNVQVVVAAPLPSGAQKDRRAYAFRVELLDANGNVVPGAEGRADGSTITVEFTPDNWDVPQTVRVIADDTVKVDEGRLFTRDDVLVGGSSVPGESTSFDFDDDAFEGQTTGVITHLIRAGTTTDFENGDLLNVSNDLTQVTLNGEILIADQLTVPATPPSIDDIPRFGLFFFDIFRQAFFNLLLAQFNAQQTEAPTVAELLGDLDTDELIGRRLSIASGDGFGESRFITAVNVDGEEVTFTLSSPWDVANAPSAGNSEFQISFDDSFTGIVDSFFEVEPLPGSSEFDDRSTLTDLDGEFGANGSLKGRIIQLIAGPGAGQELLVLDNTNTTLTLNGLWTENPVPGETIYRIEQYDGLQIPSLEVTINDNDTPGLVVDQTRSLQTFDIPGFGDIRLQVQDIDTVTSVIEGSDGDQRGEQDVVVVSLNKTPTSAVTLRVLFNQQPGGPQIAINGDSDGLIELQLSNTNEVALNITALNDLAREANHTDLISFELVSAQGDTTDTTTDRILLTEEETSIGLSFVPESITSITIDGLARASDRFLVAGNQILFLDEDGLPEPILGLIEVAYVFEIPGFDGADAEQVLVRIADDDTPTVIVRETGGSTDVIEVNNQSTDFNETPGFENDTYELVLSKAPDEGETVKIYVLPEITKTSRTGGIVFQELQVEVFDANGDDRFGSDAGGLFVEFTAENFDIAAVVGVSAIADGVVDGGDTKVFAPQPASVSSILGPVFIDGAGGAGSLDGLVGPLMLPGETNVKVPNGTAIDVSNTDSLTQITISRDDLDADLLEDLRFEFGSVDGFNSSQIEDLVGLTLEITDSANAPSLTGQFRLIVNVEEVGNTVILTLNEPYDLGDGEDLDGDTLYAITTESLNFFLDETEAIDFLFVNDQDSPADTSAVLTQNRLTGLNMGPDVVIAGRERPGGLNFENLEVMELNLGTGFNNLDVRGTLRRDDGFQTWTIINTGTDIDDPDNPSLPDRVGDTVIASLNAEEIEIGAGTGIATAINADDDNVRTSVSDAAFAAFAGQDLSGYELRLNPGTESSQVRTILSNSGDTLVLSAPLDVDEDGETTIDEATVWSIVDPIDGSVAINTEGGDDVIDASASTLGIVAFGGDGTDVITGGSGADIIFGDQGRVDYVDANGKIVTRLGSTPEVITGNAAAPFAEVGDTVLTVDVTNLPVADTNDFTNPNTPSETADTGLAGLFLDINDGTGFLQPVQLITSNTATTLTLDPAFIFDLDETSEFRISTTPEDQTDGVIYGPGRVLSIASELGGDDDLFGGSGADILIGGEGNDEISGAGGDDIAIGDLGVVEFEIVPGAPANPSFGDLVETQLLSIRSINVEIAGNDTISGEAGADFLIGGGGMDTVFGDDEDATNSQFDPAAAQASLDSETQDGEDLILGDSGFIGFIGGLAAEGSSYNIGGAADILSGNAGGDQIIGGLGGDQISGDAVFEKLSNADGDDILIGDNGRFILSTTEGFLREPVFAESFLDALGGSDSITGDAGSDLIIGGAGGDNLTGDDVAGTSGDRDGDDIIFGDNAELSFVLGVSMMLRTTDVSSNTGGNDTLSGRAGSDVLVGGVGADVLRGDELVPVSELDGDDIILGDNGEILFSDIDTITGTSELDEISSGLDALGGDDTITGNAGADIAIGGFGNDQIDGDDINATSAELDLDDLLVGDNATLDFVSGQLASLVTTDQSSETGGNDSIAGRSGGDIIWGGAGSDTLFGEGNPVLGFDGDDLILGDNGEARFDLDGNLATLDRVATFEDGIGNADTINGQSGGDIILGGFGGDILDGNDGLNQLPELDGDDIILGDNGEILIENGNLTEVRTFDSNVETEPGDTFFDDTISGYAGADILIGGVGSDRIDGFVVGSDEGVELDGADLILGDNGEAFFSTTPPPASLIDSDGDGVMDDVDNATFVHNADQRDTDGDGRGNVVDPDFDNDGDIDASDVAFFSSVFFAPNTPGAEHADFDGDGVVDALDVSVFADFFFLGAPGASFLDIDPADRGIPTPTGVGLSITLNANSPRFVDVVQTLDVDQGGVDSITGAREDDIILGGAEGDTIDGGIDDDVILGDFGRIELADDPRTDEIDRIAVRIFTTDSAEGGDDTINGDDGIDIILGGAQADTVFGGNDDDIILGDNGEVQRDFLNDRTTVFTVDPAIGGNDSLTGDQGDDIILGGAEDDTITAGTEDDIVLGDNGIVEQDRIAETQSVITLDPAIGGVDLIFGGDDDDIIVGGADQDTIFGGADDDIVFGDNGQLEFFFGIPRIILQSIDPTIGDSDSISGDDGEDIIFGGTAGDNLSGGADFDLIFGDHGIFDTDLSTDPGIQIPTSFDPRQASRSIFTQNADLGAGDTITGDGADDVIYGQQGGDTIFGGLGEDDIIGGHNVLGGADGDDIIEGDEEADVILGDNGRILRGVRLPDGDWPRHPEPFADVIREVVRFDDLEAVLQPIQEFDPFFGSDTIRGEGGDDIIQGQRGNDSIDGGAGDDEIIGQLGDDTVRGGDGNDIVLGDVGEIVRALNPDGTPRINETGEWHRDVFLEEIGTIIDVIDMDTTPLRNPTPDLAERIFRADIALLVGAYNPDGSKVINPDNGAWDTDLVLVDLVQSNNDVVDGGDGKDIVFGQRGDDDIQGGGGNDAIFGDGVIDIVGFETNLPQIVSGLRLIDVLGGLGVQVTPGGSVVVPDATLLPEELTTFDPQLSPVTNIVPAFAELAKNDALLRDDGTSISAFIQVITDLAHHSDVLPGNDTIRGDGFEEGETDGADLIIGDNARFAPLPARDLPEIREAEEDVEETFVRLLDIMRNVGIEFDIFESEILGVDQPFEIFFGNDLIIGGAGDDDIYADDLLVLPPATVLGITSNEDFTAEKLAEHAFLKDLEYIATDFTLLLREAETQVLQALVDDARDEFDDRKPRDKDDLIPLNLRNFVFGNDSVEGGSGNDVIFGDASVLATPALSSENARNTSIGRDPLDVPNSLKNDTNRALRDQDRILDRVLEEHVEEDHRYDFDGDDDDDDPEQGVSRNQQEFIRVRSGYQFNVGNDELSGGSEDDLVIGDTGLGVAPSILEAPETRNEFRKADNAIRKLTGDLLNKIRFPFESTVAPDPFPDLEGDDDDDHDPSPNVFASSDRIFGDDGDDILFGDNAVIIPDFDRNDRSSVDTIVLPVTDEGGDDDDDDLGFGFDGDGDDDDDGQPGQDDILFGGDGEDYLSGGGGRDALFGGDQDDILAGDSGVDSLFGGNGRDDLFGGGDVDGDDGDDDDDPRDFFDGGPGIDRTDRGPADSIDLDRDGVKDTITSLANPFTDEFLRDIQRAEDILDRNSDLWPVFNDEPGDDDDGDDDDMTASSIGAGSDDIVTDADLDAIKAEAIRRLAETEDLSPAEVARLNAFTIDIGDLTGATLGTTHRDRIVIDDDAAGHGWFIDETPADDAEFASDGYGGPDGMDLLTVTMHELGHVLGFEHSDAGSRDYMMPFLDPMQRLGLVNDGEDEGLAVYDRRVDAVIGEQEAALLDLAGAKLPSPASGTGTKSKNVNWAGS
ncbi:MAG: matrixin family metalloprotease [Pseudomonadota bacterium]